MAHNADIMAGGCFHSNDLAHLQVQVRRGAVKILTAVLEPDLDNIHRD